MEIYIVAVVISLVLISILFFALRSTVKRIDYNTKKYFVDKLQDYDYLIEEKQQILNNLNKEIEENKKALGKIEKQTKIEEKPKERKYYNNSNIPKYTDEQLFKKYKDIKEKFSFNFKNIIKNFLDTKLTEDTGDYSILLNIRRKFSNEVIYSIMSLTEIKQREEVNRILEKEEILVLKKYIKMPKFNINKFITNLDTAIEQNDPIVYVYTGEKDRNYNFISDKIKTVYDQNVNEGIRISYKGNLYDYSL